MLKFYKLLNYEVSRNLTKVLIICLVTIMSPIIFINNMLSDYSNIHKRFETIYESSGCIIAFAVFFLQQYAVFVFKVFISTIPVVKAFIL